MRNLPLFLVLITSTVLGCSESNKSIDDTTPTEVEADADRAEIGG